MPTPCSVCGPVDSPAPGRPHLCAACRAGATLSPCNGNCGLDATGHCVGCARTASEIERWLQQSAADRARIYARIAGRGDSGATPWRRRARAE